MKKEQTIVGMMHGATPRTDNEKAFLTMITDTVQGVKEEQISNSSEPHQVLFLRERAAFPLRLLQGMESYQYAYDQVKALGAAANPIHTRTDIREWLRIAPPSAEEQLSAWRAFVVGWASGVVAEDHETRYTSVGTRDVVRFTANYTDKFGMPKSDVLGSFSTPDSTVAGFKTDVRAVGRPPLEARDIIQRLCDDKRMQQQIEAATDDRLRAEGTRAVGDRITLHARQKKTELAQDLYDPYYKILTEYLEQINYGGSEGQIEGQPAASAPAASKPKANGAKSDVPAAAGAKSVKERLAELKELLDDAIISQEEYDQRRKEILSEL